MNNVEIATTILNQLGGKRFIAFTGLLAFKNFDQMPSQWAKKGVNEIKQAYIGVGEGDKVKVFTVSEWYAKQIQYLKGFIDSNNQIISSL